LLIWEKAQQVWPKWLPVFRFVLWCSIKPKQIRLSQILRSGFRFAQPVPGFLILMLESLLKD
jgi:hypothetical protein